MKITDIVALREDQLDSFYSALLAEQQEKLILIEDTKENKLLVSYPNGKKDVVVPIALGLYASTWPNDAVVVRIDSYRFLSCVPMLEDSEIIKEAKTICKRIHENLPKDYTRDTIEYYLQELLHLIQFQENTLDHLTNLNDELDSIIYDSQEECSPCYEFSPEQGVESNICMDSELQEPTQEESPEKLGNKILTREFVDPQEEAQQ